jgi:hypothetical protein
MRRLWRFLVLATVTVGCGAASGAAPPPVERLTLPPGFKVGVFAYPVPGARSLTLGSRGTVFVGTRDEGVVYALRFARSPAGSTGPTAWPSVMALSTLRK